MENNGIRNIYKPHELIYSKYKNEIKKELRNQVTHFNPKI